MGPLQYVEESFLVQVWDKTTRNEWFLDLVLTNGDELIKGVKTGDSLGCNNLALIDFVISRSTVKTMNIERVKFQLFRGQMNKISWVAVPKIRGADQSWFLFKAAFLRVKGSLCHYVGNQAKQAGNWDEWARIWLSDWKGRRKSRARRSRHRWLGGEYRNIV